jgi:hypothetical protein
MLRNHKVIPSLIPTLCNSLVQLLYISINRPLKDKIRDFTDEAIITSDIERCTLIERRILTNWYISNACYEFAINNGDTIRRIFWNLGLSLPVNGSKYYELYIKGFECIEVGDWN